MKFRVVVAMLAIAFPAVALAQSPESAATAAEKQYRDLTMMQSLQRLKAAEETLGGAIRTLQSEPQQAKQPANTAAPATNPARAPLLADRPEEQVAVQQAEQALGELRRAIDDIELVEEQRQRMLDRLDDADSAMRMARQPDAKDERLRLAEKLDAVRHEVKLAQDR